MNFVIAYNNGIYEDDGYGPFDDKSDESIRSALSNYRNIGRRSNLHLNPVRRDLSFVPAYINFNGIALLVLKKFFAGDDEVTFSPAIVGDAIINTWGEYISLSGDVIEKMFLEKIDIDKSIFNIVKRNQIMHGDGSPWKDAVVAGGKDPIFLSLMATKKPIMSTAVISSAHLKSRWRGNFFFFYHRVYYSQELVSAHPDLEVVSPQCVVTWP